MYTSNDKVEKIIKTIKESILKSNKKRFINKLAELIEKCNISFHIEIGCTSLEAVNDKSGKVMVENSFDGKYANEFKNRFCEKFEKSRRVTISKNENLLVCSKYSKRRVLDERKVVERSWWIVYGKIKEWKTDEEKTSWAES